MPRQPIKRPSPTTPTSLSPLTDRTSTHQNVPSDGTARVFAPALSRLMVENPSMLVRLQRTIGNRTASRMIQRKIMNTTHDVPLTPAAAIKAVTKIPTSRMKLHDSVKKADKNVTRAKQVTAMIAKKSLRPKGGRSGDIPPIVGGMAKAEQEILNGIHMKKYFDAGHLIADELTSGDDRPANRSFELDNLAPQHSGFNQEAYRVMERKVRRWANYSNKVTLETTLTYEDDYEVTIRHLIHNEIIKEDDFDTYSQPQGLTQDAKVTIPRRIPQTWKLKANVQSYKRTGKKQTKSANDKRAALGRFNRQIPHPVYHDDLPLSNQIGVGTGYNFTLPKSGKTPVMSTPKAPPRGRGRGKSVSTKHTPKALLHQYTDKSTAISGKQWTPTGQISELDVETLIKKTYPNIQDNILISLKNGVNVEQIELMISDVEQIDLAKAEQLYEKSPQSLSKPSSKDKPALLAYYKEAGEWFSSVQQKNDKAKRQKILDAITQSHDPIQKLEFVRNYLAVIKAALEAVYAEKWVVQEQIRLNDEINLEGLS
ncbi:MAG: DNA/RNA non-specific endonuclease [Anaerolineae bacterium]|nr:DNA/RNA non-specific endonuclease [Anaerolineae bacterium]